MAVTIGLSGPALVKAGIGVSAVMTADASLEIETFMEQAEAYLCVLTEYDLVTNYGSLNAVYKKLLDEYVERAAAIEAIKYDTNGYVTRIEAEDLINVNWARMKEIKTLLEKSTAQDFMGI